MEKIKVRIVKNEENKYNIYAEDGGESIPFGQSVYSNRGIAIFELSEWNTREAALKYIESKEGILELLEV